VLADRYRVEREVGAGGMATVYLAEDLKHDRKVAVKVLRPELAAAIGAERFLAEIKTTASLQHPHILPLLDSGATDSFLFYVMPFIAGESLRDRLTREKQLPIADAVRIATEVAGALEYAHRHGVIHRDIKPENILLYDSSALVADFGIALALSTAGGERLTSTGISVGSPAYMSPEQATAQRDLDARSDIYSLGCVLYEMLAGDLPFSGRTAQSITARKLTQPVPSLRTVRETVTEALDHTVEKALAKVPADRHNSCREFAEALHTATTGLSTPAPTALRLGLPHTAVWLLGGALVTGAAIAVTMSRGQPATIVIGKRTVVAAGPDLEVFPSISPDGKTVSYTLRTPTTSKLFVQQVDGGSAVPVATHLSGRQDYGAFSPDGTKLLFHGPEGLYVMPALGGQARLIVRGTLQTGVYWGSWAPDGKRIAYVQSGSVFIQSLESSSRTAVADGVDLHSPVWSPDGYWIAFVSGNSSFYDGNIAPSALRLVRAAGGLAIPLTDSLALNTSPIWVPGKRALLFISDRDGGRDVYQMFLTHSGAPAAPPVRLTTGLNPERISISADGKRMAWSVFTRKKNIWSLPIPTRDSLPLSQAREETAGTQQIENLSISWDGQWLYYDSDRNGNQDIWRKPLTGGEPEVITTDRADDFQPAVSPDGREVAFHSMRTGNRDIFVVSAVGGPATQISTSPDEDNDVTWSPDGRALIWTSDERESSAWIARREDNGSWGAPTHLPLGPTGSLRMLRWSPDNRWIFFSDSAGLELWTPATQERQTLVHGVEALFVAWSEDSRALYGLTYDRALGRAAIVAVAVPEGKLRVLAYADNPRGQQYGSGFAVRDGRMYFTLEDENSDIWVGEVTAK
jgi:eukaryotic-like serine/threonine-protein kinase